MTAVKTMIGRDLATQIERDMELAIRRATRANARRFRRSWRSEISDTSAIIAEDLATYARRDAAAASNPTYVYRTYAGFKSVRDYRVAHMLYAIALQHQAHGEPHRWLLSAARLLSEESKVGTGVEIHPAASIGRRLVIDHGYGTVIGEQVEIGDDCYILQGVVLGSRAIADTSSLSGPRRHPSIGSRVEIGSNVLILGPVRVGDDCRIEPGARIVTNVPPKSHIRIITPVQIQFGGRTSIAVYQIVAGPGAMRLIGVGLGNIRPAVLDDSLGTVGFLEVLSSSDQCLEFIVPREASLRAIGLFCETELACCLTNLGALSTGAV
jgi:serine O-acetyltransferase